VAGVSDVANVARDSIGRYFSLVSLLPSALLVFYVFLLLASDGWSGRPDLRYTASAVFHLGLTGIFWLIITSIGIALVFHPLQFVLVQLLEGYWGASWLAQRARSFRMQHHWQRVNALKLQRSLSQDKLKDRGELADDEDLRGRMELISRIAETGRLSQFQLPDQRQAMPTRLGMVLRFYESSAGEPYGLNAIQVMPYMARVAEAEDMAYVNDQRSQLDLTVRMSVTAMFACVLTVVLLWRDGLWLLVALLPYMVAYLSYRGAIVAASQYGQAVAVVIALNRFALYERLHLPLPATASAERRAAGELAKSLDYDNAFAAIYRHPSHPEGRS
jgi:type IV secretory pathway VirB3-like protein